MLKGAHYHYNCLIRNAKGSSLSEGNRKLTIIRKGKVTDNGKYIAKVRFYNMVMVKCN